MLSRSSLHRGGGWHPQQLADGDAALSLGLGAVDRNRVGDEALELEDTGSVGRSVRHTPGDGRAQQRIVVVKLFA